jgi:hypothetical protein
VSADREFDFWYAVQNTRIVLLPSRRLETFGNTILNYHLVSELMDTANKCRVREGRIQAFRPQIITPASFADTLLEGFGEEAQRYVEWLREHEQDLRILQYGFTIRKQEISEHVITEALQAVVERVARDVRGRDDPLAAVVVGVEQPWEVSLLKLMVEVSGHSLPGNIRELERHRLMSSEAGPPAAVRDEIEREFKAAAHDASRIEALGRLLQRRGLFEQYEDRFFDLVRSRHPRASGPEANPPRPRQES